MKRMLLLLSVVIVLTVSTAAVSVAAAQDFQLTEREAAKIAFSDYVKVHGQVMIPELGLRVTSVSETKGNFSVVLSVYEKLTNNVLYECATYTVEMKTGRIVSVKLATVRFDEGFVKEAVQGIESQDNSKAEAVVSMVAVSSAFKSLFGEIRNAAMADVMNGKADSKIVSNYFDNVRL